MKRSPMPPRTARLKTKTPVKRRNAKRRVSEFARCYGSRERVRFVKNLPCVVCLLIHPLLALSTGNNHNAHTENGGRGRKGDASTIIPLCPEHHRCYDQHRPPLSQPESRAIVKSYAPTIEAAWRAHVGQVHGTPTQRTA